MTKLLQRRHRPIVLLLIAAFLIGVVTVRDYGESWDEADIYRYSQYSLQAYTHFFHAADLRPFNTNLNLYGPGYYMLTGLASRLLTTLIPAWSPVDAWHFCYFLTFLGGATALYLLSRRWTSDLSALGVTLLFLSQPLLWGHSFINPKDIPFMAFFSGAVYTGLRMIDIQRSSFRFDWNLMLAAVLLGLTAAFRAVGPLAGLIVLGYGAYVLRGRSIGLGAIYVGSAAVTTYLSWPYLWSGVVAHYFESISTMAEFPFSTQILFQGHLYMADTLPWSYYPTFLAIQLSEPALLLIGLGFVGSLLLLFKERTLGPLPLVAAWFLAPAIYIVGSRSPLYDNARQLLFLLPPLFILAGVALERLFTLLPQPAIRGAILLGAALPGILLSIRLHPYEYVYYNILTGGTGGAYRQYELDYWGTSFKEVTEYLDSTAAPGVNVLAFGPEQLVEQYARPDIHVFIPGDQPEATYSYAAILTRDNLDLRRCKGAVPIYSVERRGAVFALLKAIPEGSECR